MGVFQPTRFRRGGVRCVFETFSVGQAGVSTCLGAFALRVCIEEQLFIFKVSLRRKTSRIRGIASSTRAAPTPECTLWKEAQPPEVACVTKGFNYDLFCTLARTSGIEVGGLLSCFQYGFPVLGQFGAPGVFPSSECGAPASVGSLLSRSGKLWADVPSFCKGVSREEREAMWDLCVSESKKGWLSNPTPLCDFDKSGAIPVRRFPIAQGDKTRYIDNLKRSYTNKSAATTTPIRLPGVDTLALLASAVANAHVDVSLWKSDHESAYKMLPVRPGHASFCVIVAQHPDGSWRCFKPRSLLFGSSHAVLAYSLVSRVLSFLISKFLMCLVSPILMTSAG